MLSFSNGVRTLARASSSRVRLRSSAFTTSYTRRFYSDKHVGDVDHEALHELLEGKKFKPSSEQKKAAPLPQPHAFPSRDSGTDVEDGPPVGPPGTGPIPPPGRAKGKNAAGMSPWDLKRQEESSGKKTSDVMDSKEAQYRLCVHSSPNNCIMTLVNDEGKPTAAVSAGMCGFRNIQESTYEAGYQVSVRMFEIIRSEIQRRGDKKMKLEIQLKGFGQSRQALLKALTMTEGVGVREVVNRITDRTPIKVGGVRAQKARRM